MKKVFLIALALIVAAGNLIAQEMGSTTQTRDYIEVTVNAEKEFTPDEIFIAITINEKDNRGKASVLEQEKQMIKALSGLGINVKEKLTVDNLGSSQKNNALKKGNIYVSKNYTLEVGTAQLATKAILELNQLGIARVKIDRISMSEKLVRQAKDQLLAEAAKKAKENAAIMAEAVGSKVGKVIYMKNYYSFKIGNAARMTKAYGMDTIVEDHIFVCEQEIDLNISNQEISVMIDCKFLLE